MKAMVFAAGLGTRLRPETENKPKALVEVGGKPMLQHVIENLKSAGVDFIVINVHHFAEKIVKFLNDNNNFETEIHISDESDLLLDTGGGVVKAASMLEDAAPVILHNADILTDVSLREIYDAHTASGSGATLLVDASRNSSRKLLFDDNGIMRGWINCNTMQTRPTDLNTSNLNQCCFDGVHVLSQSALKQLADYGRNSGPFSITDFYINACRNVNITGFQIPHGRRWFDIGSPEKLSKARAAYI